MIKSVEILPEGRRITIQPAFLDDAATPLRRSVRVRLRAGDDTPLEARDSVDVRAIVRPPAPPVRWPTGSTEPAKPAPYPA
ncbi:MAG TPA: hypothetical protein VHU77_12730, partial [Candidatus Limnocylindria bacterium]|nr:hypothetical protein [Candidatus Limnocylindria bacterium]